VESAPLCGVVELILPIFPVRGRGVGSPVRGRGVGSPVRGRGVYTPDIPCTGSWSLYSRYSLYGVVELILPIFPVRGRGVDTPVIPRAGSWSLYS